MTTDIIPPNFTNFFAQSFRSCHMSIVAEYIIAQQKKGVSKVGNDAKFTSKFFSYTKSPSIIIIVPVYYAYLLLCLYGFY